MEKIQRFLPDVTTEGVVVALLSTSGVVVVDGTPDVTTEGIVVALLSTSLTSNQQQIPHL
jgi:hypothetical protein